MLYHWAMGYSTEICREPKSGHWMVSLKVVLSRTETNELFLSGDAMLSWPVEGLAPASGEEPMPERSGMFVSEVAAHPTGLVISYSDQADAERAVALLRVQLAEAGIKEEA